MVEKIFGRIVEFIYKNISKKISSAIIFQFKPINKIHIFKGLSRWFKRSKLLYTATQSTALIKQNLFCLIIYLLYIIIINNKINYNK
jgi:uncharacterized Fe-S radical SAM superfamily protein PflX